MKKISLLCILACFFSSVLVAHDADEELRNILGDFASKYDHRVSVSGADLHYYHNKKIKIEEKLGQQITELLMSGARVEDSSRHPADYQAIHFAAESGNLTLLELLLSMKANIDAPGPKKWTPLFYAARNGHEGICRKLLDCGANAKLVDDQGQTCLMIANGDLIEIFLGKLDINARRKDGATAAGLAVENDDADTLEKLLHMHVQLPLPPSNPVVVGNSWVVKKENWPLKMLLIGAGHSMSSLHHGGPYSPLFNKFLEQNSAGPEPHLFSEALEIFDYQDVVKTLEENYQLPNENILYTAIRLKDTKIFASVLLHLCERKKAHQVNDAISYGTTPLFFALYMKNFKAVPLLLEFGADPAYGWRDLAYYVKSISDEKGIKLVQSLKKQAINFYRQQIQRQKTRVDVYLTSLPSEAIDKIIYYVFF